MNDREIEKVLAYLREQSGRYSEEALRGQLLDTGYDPETVDWAIQIHQGNNPEPPKARIGQKALLVTAANSALAAIAIAATTQPGVTKEVQGAFGYGLALLAGAEFLGGTVMSFFEETEAWGSGLILGLLISAGLSPLFFVGWCVYAFARSGAH